MSTQNKTQTTNAYNATSMGVYGGFQPYIQSGMQDYASNPLTSNWFNQQLGYQRRAGQVQGNSMNQGTAWNQNAIGNIANPNAYLASQQAHNQRSALARQGQGFNNLLLNANQVRMSALNAQQNYRPLQTGQTQIQSVSGLGSWLPQVAGAALHGAAMAGGGTAA